MRIDRVAMIQAIPCFGTLTVDQCNELADLMTEVTFSPNTVIVNEDDLVDSIYLIYRGTAEVTRIVKQHRKLMPVPVAVLHEGEAIGLNDTGFYSQTGKRTATVTATSQMTLLRLDIKDLYLFLQRHTLETNMYAAADQMLRMRLIKQSLPFGYLSHERLQWLANLVEEINVPANTILFHQGEAGDTCYLIRSGQVEIMLENTTGEAHNLAVLKSPALFGEATLITDSPRNATARTLTDTTLLVLRHKHLTELLESEENVGRMFMMLTVDRSRPMQNPNVTAHARTTADGQQLVILKNPDNGSYFKLSQEGWFVWQQLHGELTMQDITLALSDQFNFFSPDVVAGLISKLARAGFISNVQMKTEIPPSQPMWIRAMLRIRNLLEMRVAIGDADKWLTRMYNKRIHFLFTRPGQLILALLAIGGLVAFGLVSSTVLVFFSHTKHISWTLLLVLIPLSLMTNILHELGHAFAVKSYGREVHYMGVGWYWFAPVGFTDTSDMWLTTRGPRTVVNLAGAYCNLLVAGTAAIIAFALPMGYVQALLWLFSIYTYISAFNIMSPLQEYDGYYVLMDWLDRPRLRQSAVLWLVKGFPKALRQPRLFREHLPEVGYWLTCLIYLFLVCILTFYVQDFILKILGIHQGHPATSLIIPLVVVIISSLGVIADIKNRAEE